MSKSFTEVLAKTKTREEVELDILRNQELAIKRQRPHIYRFKMYTWAREFFDSKEKINLLCAANQLGKSSTQIRKAIEWATNRRLWPELWVQQPSQFWYLYPTSKQARIEFETKWKQFLPPESMRDDPNLGWKLETLNREPFCIRFNSGVGIYFKFYSQSSEALQTGTVDAIFCFVAGTKILTPQGEKSVEDISVGDLVLTKNGWEPVVRTMSQVQPVLTRKFSNGKSLTGTKDHPVLTARGWVELGELLPGDICFTVPECLNQILSWCSSRVFCSKEDQNTKIQESGDTLGRTENIYTFKFGKRLLVKSFMRASLSTIGTGIRWITGSKILSFLAELTIPLTIKEKSGKKQVFIPAYVRRAVKNLPPAAQKVRFLDGALRSAVNWLTSLFPSALSVGWNSPIAKISGRCTVLGFAQIEPEQRVYNLEVTGSHTYFANGILTHNCDEELPMDHYNELMFRLSASEGYFHMVFTATIGQEFWRMCMEPRKDETENLPHAKKWVVSLYDSRLYEDGSESPWTIEKIKTVEAKCSSELEVQKRVMGRFVLDDPSAKLFPEYNPSRHFIKGHDIPESWMIYAGVDIGSGNSPTAHPAAISFVAVSPDLRKARVVKAWRGDKTPTTVADIVKKYIDMKKELGRTVVAQFFDWSSADFYPIAVEMGEGGFRKAEKGEKGIDMMNVMFKNDMLMLYSSDPEIGKLSDELMRVRAAQGKSKRKDDLCDATRYAISTIPFDFSGLVGKSSSYEDKRAPVLSDAAREQAQRRGLIPEDDAWFKQRTHEINEEIGEWNDLYG